MFAGDELSTTFHLGAFVDNQLVGVVTSLQNQHSDFEVKNQYQLRGMGILPQFQKTGVGKLLVEKAEAAVLKKGSTFIWMNAREKAVNFYKKLGYKPVGSIFNIPDVGPHYVMIKHL